MIKYLNKIVSMSLAVIIGSLVSHSAYGNDPRINVWYENSEPEYYSMPAHKVRELCPKTKYTPLGCTHYVITYKYTYKTKRINGEYEVTDVDMKFYYKSGDFYVYIVNKYPQGSCEYNAIKKHEELHVKVDQTVEIDLVKAYLKTCITGINHQRPFELDFAVQDCAHGAFEADMEVRRQRNKDIDADDNNHPNFGRDCR